ncbi:branched-chain amino acid ABC transporter permease [Streptomyces abyssomicinicus]|uniref:branched-chain amino acid ABC transporter permease n=1 Tax=Streptomyces abyssomicinicus TaxID=574929 RepID=UPI00124FB61F|nr:branched-chain amino acid ABC transporter permease [Streptomyces abyssomicinicus]
MSITTTVNLASASILLAAIYCLVNTGLVLLYRSTGVLNFSHGQLVMLGAYVMSSVKIGSYPLRLAIAALVVGVVSWISYHVLIRRLTGGDEFRKVVTSFMLAILLTQIIVLAWGTDTRAVPNSTDAWFALGAAHVRWSVVVDACTAVVLAVGLTFFLSRTLSGLRMRALAANEELAAYSGIKVHRLAGLAWAIAGGGAALAGVMYAETTSVSLALADILLLAFPAAVLGGLNSIPGSILGSVIMATLLTLCGYFLGGQWVNVLAFVVLLGVLIVRPFGLLGAGSAQRL